MMTNHNPLRRELSLFMLAFTLVFFYACSPSSEEQTSDSSEIPDENWEFYGNDQTNKRYSALTQLTPENVKDLKLAWQFDLEVDEAQECTPIVVDGTMYVTTASGPKFVYALDAKTGDL
ncbi:MAG: PQQ-binding-like beta-propeller repeat protein, partial [Cyclobacteriaceae bacterium]